MNRKTLTIYKEVFDEDFNQFSSMHRTSMMNAFYLLKELGASLEEFEFSEVILGFFSKELNEEMQVLPNHSDKTKVNLSEDTKVAISKLKNTLSFINFSKDDYSEVILVLAYFYHHLKVNAGTKESSDFLKEKLVFYSSELTSEKLEKAIMNYLLK